MPDARLRLGWCVTNPSTATSGAAPSKAPAMPSAASNSSASDSRTKPKLVTTWSTPPSRSSASARRLERTDAPTSSAPASTATATATPATTARLVRQYQRTLRRASDVSVMRARLQAAAPIPARDSRRRLAAGQYTPTVVDDASALNGRTPLTPSQG